MSIKYRTVERWLVRRQGRNVNQAVASLITENSLIPRWTGLPTFLSAGAGRCMEAVKCATRSGWHVLSLRGSCPGTLRSHASPAQPYKHDGWWVCALASLLVSTHALDTFLMRSTRLTTVVPVIITVVASLDGKYSKHNFSEDIYLFHLLMYYNE
jgi:hypothetical protein